MIWPVVILVVLVVFGSVYWMKPSPRDTRLAALRLDAIKRGLHVRQFKFKPESAKNGVRDEVWGTSFTYVRPGRQQGGRIALSPWSGKRLGIVKVYPRGWRGMIKERLRRRLCYARKSYFK